MLVLSRKQKEVIVIGEGSNRIEVVVRWIGGNTVRLGIKAPRQVKILRGELPDGKEAA
jgi:carbon storage regulator